MTGGENKQINSNAIVDAVAQRMAELLVEIIQAKELRYSQAINIYEREQGSKN